ATGTFTVTYTDGTSVSFTYDAAGNRISMTAGGSTTPYTYDAAGQLKTAGSTDYTYDAAGNRLTAGSSSFTYDDFGNLASQTSGATTIAYQTNGSGLRVSATSGSTTSAYTWDAAAALPSLLSDGTADYLSADTTLLAETSASANAYPLTDALGSVRAQTDGTGTVTASASYGVYGDVRSTSGSIGSLGYTGALSDSSGLVYLQARSLDPTTGTFTSRDSLTPGGRGVTGYNPYAYAAQNPTTYTDPSGRFAAENAAIQSTTEKDIAPAEGAEAAIEAPIEGMAEDMTVEIGDEPFAADAAADPEPLAPEPETGNPLEAPRATESGPPENLSYDVGASDGGPGEWTESIERGPTDAVDFQERVTGAPRTGDAIREYEVQGVKFDGIKDPRTMLDAKNWRSWPFPEGYSPSSILQEASRQAEVCRANGLTVEWHVSGQEAANGLSQLIERRGLGDVVKVLWHPWP
ncbi:MAG: RHS repeat-associated core domain-containing protein, partial [Candidatus Limnocylindrales bacterium]